MIGQNKVALCALRYAGYAGAAAAGARLERAARGAALTGVRLLDDSLQELLHTFGYGAQ